MRRFVAVVAVLACTVGCESGRNHHGGENPYVSDLPVTGNPVVHDDLPPDYGVIGHQKPPGAPPAGGITSRPNGIALPSPK